jgi:hypothetical protein
MKNQSLLLRIFGAIAVLGCFVLAGQAQNREQHVISAKAGGVNSVTGQVLVKQEGQAERLLTNQDNLNSGDEVTTAVGARVEVLLNPGSYLRVGEGSQFEIADNSLDNLLVKLSRGTAIVEAMGADGTRMQIGIQAGSARFTIVRAGVYRINVQANLTEVLVHKGRVLMDDNSSDFVKGGNKIIFGKGSALTAKINKKDQDDLDVWSKDRANTLARANQKLSYHTLNDELFGFPWAWGFSAANPYGLWTYSPFVRCYTFLPFFYGWSSPYGHFYGSYYNLYPYLPDRVWGNRRGPVIVTNSPRESPGGSSVGSSGGSRGSSGGSPGGFGGSPTSGTSAPSSSMPSQAGPRDRDSGSRSNNRIKPPIN